MQFGAARPAIGRVLLALMAAGLLAGSAPAQQAPAQPTAPPVPSIEELKRQLEEKRQQIEAAKKQPKPHPTAESDSVAPSASKPAVAPTPALPAPAPAPERAPATPVPAATSTPASKPPAAHASVGSEMPPPPGRGVTSVRVDPSGGSGADSCPYPEAARQRGDTGTVVLLLYVAPDGRALDTRIETSSGSDVLDDGAANCVKEFGRFLPKRVGSRAEAAWFRMRFNWSFGEP